MCQASMEKQRKSVVRVFCTICYFSSKELELTITIGNKRRTAWNKANFTPKQYTKHTHLRVRPPYAQIYVYLKKKKK